MKVRKDVVDKKEKGFMTIEATISLTVFLFFMMFVMNIGHIYQVQTHMTHGALQTGKYLAFSSFAYDQVSFVDSMIDLGGLVVWSDKTQAKALWKIKNYSGAVNTIFPYCIGENLDKAEEVLEKYGVSAINFEGTTVENNDLMLNMTYDIELPYKFFGYDKITMHQRVVCGLWK